jgi:hypothetical protein
MTEGHLVLVLESPKRENGAQRLLLYLQAHPRLRGAPHNQQCGARQPCGQQGERHHELAAKSQGPLTLRNDLC